MAQVVTWQTTRGDKINVCVECQERLAPGMTWPADKRGEGYCQVYKGRHEGECDVCAEERVGAVQKRGLTYIGAARKMDSLYRSAESVALMNLRGAPDVVCKLVREAGAIEEWLSRRGGEQVA